MPQCTSRHLKDFESKLISVWKNRVDFPDIFLPYPLRKHLHPEDRSRVLKEVGKSHKTDKAFVLEYRMITKDN